MGPMNPVYFKNPAAAVEDQERSIFSDFDVDRDSASGYPRLCNRHFSVCRLELAVERNPAICKFQRRVQPRHRFPRQARPS